MTGKTDRIEDSGNKKFDMIEAIDGFGALLSQYEQNQDIVAFTLQLEELYTELHDRISEEDYHKVSNGLLLLKNFTFEFFRRFSQRLKSQEIDILKTIEINLEIIKAIDVLLSNEDLEENIRTWLNKRRQSLMEANSQLANEQGSP